MKNQDTLESRITAGAVAVLATLAAFVLGCGGGGGGGGGNDSAPANMDLALDSLNGTVYRENGSTDTDQLSFTGGNTFSFMGEIEGVSGEVTGGGTFTYRKIDADSAEITARFTEVSFGGLMLGADLLNDIPTEIVRLEFNMGSANQRSGVTDEGVPFTITGTFPAPTMSGGGSGMTDPGMTDPGSNSGGDFTPSSLAGFTITVNEGDGDTPITFVDDTNFMSVETDPDLGSITLMGTYTYREENNTQALLDLTINQTVTVDGFTITFDGTTLTDLDFTSAMGGTSFTDNNGITVSLAGFPELTEPDFSTSTGTFTISGP